VNWFSKLSDSSRKKIFRKLSMKLLVPNTVVYGPVKSRRLGWSLGINPLADESTPASDLLKKIETAFAHHEQNPAHIDFITLTGNREPSLYPEFLPLVQGLIPLRNKFFPKIKLGILSDGSQVHRTEIRGALEMLDARYMKLDAGHEKVNRMPPDFNFERMMNAYRVLRDIIIQSVFQEGKLGNTSHEDLDHWYEAVGFIQSRGVYVYTLEEKSEGNIPVSQERLHEIAETCRMMAGVPTKVF
jgi:wyosine [tRNA(Phe)-imidazoG37] synthetase (radical SAM superfamily)